MDVAQGTPDGAPPSPINGDWVLAHDAATGRFARRFTFALPTGGLADGLRWQPQTGFTLSLPTFDYDARASGAPEPATVANSGADSVRVTFPVPRTLLRVKVTGAQAGDMIEAHRVDGDAITDDAFADASHDTIGATLNAVDRQLVLRQKRAGAAVPLRATDIAQLVVRSPAASVRVGIVLPAVGSDVFYLGPDAGAVLTQPTVATQLGPALAALLQGASDRLADALGGDLLPGSIAMTLVVESDTPAQAHISGFVLRYRLYRGRFADQAPKRLFDFGGGALTTRQLALDVPRGAALWSATLRMMGPFNEPGGADPGGAGGAAEDEPEPLAAPASDLGVELHAGETAATRMTLLQAALVQGASVELVALTDAGAGRVRLLRDADGSPGETLGERPFAPLPAGIRRVVRIDFERPSVVGAGPVWVAVQCDDGALLWLTSNPGPATAGSRVLRRAPGEVAWTAVGAASDRGAAASLTVASEAGADAAPGPPAFHGVRLYFENTRLHGSAAAPGSRGDKETRFNIVDAVQQIVQSGAGGSVPVTLSLMSNEPGRVTVYPPEFEFDP